MTADRTVCVCVYVQSVCVTFVMYSQEEAGSLLVDLSSSLNTISVNQADRDDGEVVQAATPILEAASNILNVSSNVRANNSIYYH